MQPTVSILIPTYNRAAFVRAAIQSALAQTYSDIEIVVLDDASPDETPQVVAEFEDARLRLVRHPRNLGIVENWRAGLENARGEFFCFLHDDDTFEPQFVEKLLAPLQENPQLIVAFCDHWIMDEAGQRDPQRSQAASDYFKRSALEAGIIADFARTALVDYSLPVGAALFRRSMVKTSFLDERARGSIDMYLFLGCVLTGLTAFYVPERLMNYRMHAQGMSRAMPVYMAQGHVFRCQAILAQPSLASLHVEAERSLRATLSQTALSLAARGEMAQARAWARRSWRAWPNARALIALGLTCGGSASRALCSAARRLRARRRAVT